jgi:hypothetical protein
MTTERLVALRADHLVRIVRDPADATQDYFLVEPRADALYVRGELTLYEGRNGRFDYITRDGRVVK